MSEGEEMREIKFRARNPHQSRMLSWQECERISVASGMSIFQPSELVWQQFTGLKDKNGKEIYDGDICEWRGEGNLIDGNRFTVSWNEKRACWYLGSMLNPIDMQNVEVVSNIYESTEGTRDNDRPRTI